MARHYGKTEANKTAKSARKNSQNILSMWNRAAPAPAPARAAPVAAALAAAAADEMVDVEQGVVDIDPNENTNHGDGDDGGDDGNNGNIDEEEGGGGGGNSSSWPTYTVNLCNQFKKDVDESVRMVGRDNNRRPMGCFPVELSGTFSPSDDPLTFFQKRKKKLDWYDYCYPQVRIWYPEAQWPMFYENQHYRPRCKWHNSHECCVNDGWMTYPRHAYGMGKKVAVLGRKYECVTRRDAGMECHFRGIDAKVIEQSPDYVRLQWKRGGFDFSHRGGISNKALDMGRRCLIGGLSASGFQHVMLQDAKNDHLLQSALYRSWAQAQRNDLIYTAGDIQQLRRELPDYDSNESPNTAPSVPYLISRLILLMESSDEYKTRRMQMIDGLHISGDHSFKVMKCVCTRGKPFTAVYCLLNEFSQVVGWWMTTGTSMTELEEQFQKLRQRYEKHGFDGPEFATTDRCCQERAMWNNFLRPSHDDALANNPHLQPDDTTTIEVVTPPYQARFARTVDMALVLVGEISQYWESERSEGRKKIIVDGEWAIRNTKMDLLTIGLLNGRTFIFHLSQMCRGGAAFPLSLKLLLQDPTVDKIGNRICSDVAKLEGWGVTLAPTVELGHLAYARGISPTRRPSVEYLSEKLFPGVVIEGKDPLQPGPRLSNWGSPNLTREQREYAAVDGYITSELYKETLRHLDPRSEGEILPEDANDGVVVVLYLRSYIKMAEGVIRQRRNRNKVVVEINLASAETLFIKSAMVDVLKEDGSIEKKSIEALCNNMNLDSDEDSSCIKIIWNLSFCRHKPNNDPVQPHTRTKEILIEANSEEEDEIREAMNNHDDGAQEDGSGSDASESAGENDSRRRLPRNRRRRLHIFQRERVKNDILHIFLRHQRVLSTEHGAYYSYITALRDALFVLNDEDLEECLVVLREKRGMTEKQIRDMMTYNFKWFLLRVRRLVPSPPDLVKRYLEVYNTYKDVVCHKSGKKLFGTPAALAQHRATLKHMRRNCLSDIPFFTYYTPLKRDRDGLRRWACHRGTSANEGLHQKLRQLVRGFSNSPRFLKAIISEYLLMWNQNIDVKTRGLPSKYYGLYDGQLLEDEIEKLSAFLDEPSHQEWVSSKSLQCTGESFGIINPTQSPSQMVVVDSDADDEELDRMAAAAADDLSDDELDVGAEAAIDMPPSSKWLSTLTGRNRSTERIRSNDEWEYFKDNVDNFQGGGASEADNYSGIRWSDFATSWNSWVDTLRHSKPTVTYKSASHLQDAYKSMKRRAVVAATLRPHTQAITELHDRHTSRATAVTYLPEFAQPETPTVAQPSTDAVDAEDQQIAATNYDGDADEPEPGATAVPQRRKRKKSKMRCRKCGREYADDAWMGYHTVARKEVNGRLLIDNDRKVWETCTVPEEMYDEGFPCLVGRMPRKKKKQRGGEVDDCD